jgi:uncharacterized membrane protein
MTNKFLKFNKSDFFAILLIILSSLILLVDTLIYKGQPANMDGVAHITHMAVFHNALAHGDFPVRWTDGFANYGLPIGSFAQQTTSYLGAFLTFITHDVVTSFNLVYVIGTLASVLLFYVFLRFYFKTWPSFIGAFLFNFAPYRLINLYIRGTIPEYFASVFLVSILIFLYLLFKKKSKGAFIGLALSVFGMILTHPMNALTGSVLIGPYFLFLLVQEKNKVKMLLLTIGAGLLGVLLSSYYLLPLLRDIKYFYYGSGGNHYNASHLTLNNFIDPKWYYFLVERNEILSRGHFIKTGLLETIVFLAGLFFVVIDKLKNGWKKIKISFLDTAMLVGLISLFLTTELSAPLYKSIDLLSNIQFPWRMLSTFIFIPPIVVAALINKIHKKSLATIFGLVLVFIISWTRFPEVYGKNFTIFPQDYYYFTVDNIHSSNMNTIWTTETTGYPVKRDDKVAILDGDATLSEVKIENSRREFTIDAQTETRMIDYTFYFPGWKVFVDGKEVNIEFQDVEYRGVITYKVPEGQHNVEVVFENTKTVLLGNYLSIIALAIIVFYKNIFTFF